MRIPNRQDPIAYSMLRIAYVLLLLSFLASCAAEPASAPAFPTFVLITQDPNASPTSTPFQPSTGLVGTSVWTWTPIPPPADTLTATETAPFIPPPTLTNTPASPAPESAPPANSEPFLTNYLLYATLDFDHHALYVNETIRYYNATGANLSDIVLSVQPNRYPGAFLLDSISQDNTALTHYTLGDQRLMLHLPQPLAAGAATTLNILFTIDIPAKGSGLFGYDFNQINLVDWYPFVVPYQNGWVLHDPTAFGEHLVYDASDIEVNLKTDSDVVIAAGAPAEPNGEWMRYRIYGARTFVFSASDEFLVAESAVGSTVLRSYYFDGHKAAAESILYSAAQAISIFEAKFAPYPYETLAIVEVDIHDGQEYDGLVFISSKFYGEYGGGAKNNLTTIGVHEIAHQWWFGLVGNDQTSQPWLDESLATYSENIFYEYNYPKYGDWWWGFRVDYFGPGGYVDSTASDHASYRSYVNATYLNGAHFIHDLRVLMGDNDFYPFLKDYAARYSRQRASSQDFFNVLREHTSEDLRYLIAEYFAGAY